MPRDQRFVEKLATPDVTIADHSSATLIPFAPLAVVAIFPMS